MHMELSMETPYIAYLFIEDVNRGVKKMSNGKVRNTSLLSIIRRILSQMSNEPSML